MKLCVFQGTFNPIHKAHLKMADYVLVQFEFDKILFIPAYKPPHKDYRPDLSIHRFNMVKLAIQNNPKFAISDIEYKSDEKSYTYLTAKELYKKYDIEGKIQFIIGTDAFEKIESWYETDKLKEMLEFIVFVRENDNDLGRFDNLRKKGYKFKFTDMDFIDISSTELRQRIKDNKPADDLITKEVEDYIKENDLYKD